MNDDRKLSTSGYLVALIAFVTLLALVACYRIMRLNSASWGSDLCEQVIPNLVPSLITFVVIYVFFIRKGIPVTFPTKGGSLARNGLAQFYETFRDIEWDFYLGDATASIDIVVNYWDSWAADNRADLTNFFRHSNATLRLFLQDIRKKKVLDELLLLYPDRDAHELKRKVLATARIIYEAAKIASAKPSQVRAFYVRTNLTYAIQKFDNRKLVLSTYDMHRDRNVGAPAFVLNLVASERLRKYWSHEIEGLLRHSQEMSEEAVIE